MLEIKYVHTNIISDDWKRLSNFYETVFGCVPIPPERNQSGSWLEKGTGVKNASLTGVHLRLPGYGSNGPTLEIYQYCELLNPGVEPAANRKGIGHLAFKVNNVELILNSILLNGGKAIGKISQNYIEGLGTIEFVYAADPEGNILEIQNWSK